MTKIRPEQLNASIRDIPLPDNMLELPVSSQGYPVPFFVSKVNGEWDFRVVEPEKAVRALKHRLCWVCGQRMGPLKAFVAGPMCVITKTSAEPPCHYSCARYAAIACPFLAQPRMRRNVADLPDGHTAPAGMAIMRNPGVTAVLLTRGLKTFRAEQGAGTGFLIRMGEPEAVEWYAQRRRATRAEVDASIQSGISLLEAEADKDGPEGRTALAEYIEAAEQWLPERSRSNET